MRSRHTNKVMASFHKHSFAVCELTPAHFEGVGERPMFQCLFTAERECSGVSSLAHSEERPSGREQTLSISSL